MTLLRSRQEGIVLGSILLATSFMSFVIYKSIAERFVTPELLQEISSEWQNGGTLVFPFELPGVPGFTVNYSPQLQKYPIRISNCRGFMAIFKVPVQKLKDFSIPAAFLSKDPGGLAELFLLAMTGRQGEGADESSEVDVFIKTEYQDPAKGNKLTKVLHPLVEWVNSENDMKRGIFLYHHPKVLSQISTQASAGTLQYNVDSGGKFVMSVTGLAVLNSRDAMAESYISSKIDNKLVLTKFDMEHKSYGDSFNGGEMALTWGPHPLAIILKNAIGETKPTWYRYLDDGYGLLSRAGAGGPMIDSDSSVSHDNDKRRY